jgi:hypothetical protein
LDDAINLNNRAATHLSDDDDEEFVIDCFVEAMGFLKSYALDRGMLSTGDTATSTDEADATTASLLQDLHVQGLVCLPLVPGECRGKYDPSSHVLCDRALIIVPPPATLVNDPQVQKNLLPLYISCILYNLALTHHRYAIKRDDGPMFRKAYCLYSAIYRQLTLPISAALPCIQNHIVSKELCTAVLNNLGDICYHQSRHEMTAHIAGNLSSLLRSLQQHNQQRRRSAITFVTGKDMDNIVMNVLMWKSPLLPPAA